MKTILTRSVLAGFVFVAMTLLTAHSTSAQCVTCPSPTVAYQPVVVQPTTVYQPTYQPVATSPRRGWYPGKLLDRMRLRHYGATAMAPNYAPYTASYAPYTASYAPYTAGYAPYASPYVSAYAPLTRTVARPLVQTSYYYPQVAPSHCSSCVQTVARPVVLSPVVTTGCSTCAFAPCSGCPACSTGVSQASFTQSNCSSCATSASVPSYSAPSLEPSYPSGSGTVGPPTGQPYLSPNEPAPSQSNYPQGESSVVDPLPREDVDPNDSSTSFDVPKLLDPHDRTARHSSSNGPTVDVWNAVYRKSTTGKVSQASHKPSQTQAEIDAEGWHAVPRSR